jgi:hypothetical protein
MTTDSSHGRKIYPNLVRRIVLTNMGQLWIADITIRTVMRILRWSSISLSVNLVLILLGWLKRHSHSPGGRAVFVISVDPALTFEATLAISRDRCGVVHSDHQGNARDSTPPKKSNKPPEQRCGDTPSAVRRSHGDGVDLSPARNMKRERIARDGAISYREQKNAVAGLGKIPEEVFAFPAVAPERRFLDVQDGREIVTACSPDNQLLLSGDACAICLPVIDTAAQMEFSRTSVSISRPPFILRALESALCSQSPAPASSRGEATGNGGLRLMTRRKGNAGPGLRWRRTWWLWHLWSETLVFSMSTRGD